MEGDAIAVVPIPGLRHSNSIGKGGGCVDIWRGGIDALPAWLDGQLVESIGLSARGGVLGVFAVIFRNYPHHLRESTCVIAPPISAHAPFYT